MNETLSSTPASSHQSRATHDEISQRAQQLWETLGRPVGRDEEIWLQAEQELQASPPAAAAARTPDPVTKAPISSAPASTKASASPRKSSGRTKAAAR